LSPAACATGQRLHIDDHRLEPGRLRHRDAILHLVLARGGDQDLDIPGAAGCGADPLEVEIDLLERERDVLIGLGLDRELHLGLAQAFGENDLLGDDRGRRQRERHVAHAGAEAAQRAPHGFAHRVEVGDVAIDHRIARQGLDRIALHFVSVLFPGR